MIYAATKIKPGINAPINKSATEMVSGLNMPIFNWACWYALESTSANKIRAIEGGMICPSVPVAQMVPVANAGL